MPSTAKTTSSLLPQITPTFHHQSSFRILPLVSTDTFVSELSITYLARCIACQRPGYTERRK